jgi:hypothetical protein
MDTRGCLPGGKRPKREAAHWCPFCAEVKNKWSYTSTSVCLHGLYGEYFTFIFTYISGVIKQREWYGLGTYYGRSAKCVQKFSWKHLKVRDDSRDLGGEEDNITMYLK